MASSNPTRWESRSLGVSPQVRTILNSVLVTSLVLVGLNTPSHAPIALELATFTKSGYESVSCELKGVVTSLKRVAVATICICGSRSDHIAGPIVPVRTYIYGYTFNTKTCGCILCNACNSIHTAHIRAQQLECWQCEASIVSVDADGVHCQGLSNQQLLPERSIHPVRIPESHSNRLRLW